MIGFDCNLGDGTKLANLRLDGNETEGRYKGGEKSGVRRRKLGSVLEDRCKIGCNVVLNPGTYLESGTGVYIDPHIYQLRKLGNA